MKAKNNILALTFLESHPAKAADILEQMEFKAVAEFLTTVPHMIAGPVVNFILPHYAAKILSFLDVDTAVAILSAMHAKRAAFVLRCGDKAMRKAVTKKLPAKIEVLLSLYLDYAEDMVGAWMSTDILLLSEDCTGGEALRSLEQMEENITEGTVYVINNELRLQGSFSIRKLLCQSPDTLVNVIMEQKKVALVARSTLLSIKDHPGWEIENTLPVLNRNKQLIGVLSHAELHRGLNQVSAGIKDSEDSDVATGLFQVYGTVLLSLFEAFGGLGAHYKAKQAQMEN